MNLTLLLLLFFCHFLADYTHLSRPHMLQAKRFGTPLLPILEHALVHSVLMCSVLLFFVNDFSLFIILWIFQTITHFLIDVWKGKMNKWFPSLQSPANTWHWVVFGADQYLHAVVILLMAYFI